MLQKHKNAVTMAKKVDFSDILDFNDESIPFRERMEIIEERLRELPEVQFEYKHTFHGGLYARTMYSPAGILMTSYIYTKPHQCIISSGTVSYRSEVMGGKIRGPFMFTADAGSKRIVYTHTPMVWTTVIKTDADNVEDAESEIYIKTYEEWDSSLMNDIVCMGV
jgi:hypothetical protein